MAGTTPQLFQAACESLGAAKLRSELAVREIPSPERIAPHAIAYGAGVMRGQLSPSLPEDEVLGSPYGSGRFVLMCDPDAVPHWGGPLRVVCFAQAPLEHEIGVDPFMAEVAWSWLVDALETHGAAHTFLSGTATKVLSSSFGSISHRGDAAHIELRASWTPVGDVENIRAHAEAWGDLLCSLAGLPHEGVASLSALRGQRQ